MSTTATPTNADTVRELGRVSKKLAKAEAEVDRLRAERLALLEAGRAHVPPITNRALGEACGMTEWNVMKLLRKARGATE